MNSHAAEDIMSVIGSSRNPLRTPMCAAAEYVEHDTGLETRPGKTRVALSTRSGRLVSHGARSREVTLVNDLDLGSSWSGSASAVLRARQGDSHAWVKLVELYGPLIYEAPSAAEVGDQLGMSRAAVREAKYRILKRLRKLMADARRPSASVLLWARILVVRRGLSVHGSRYRRSADSITITLAQRGAVS